MRGHYLQCTDHQDRGGCRGGVGSNYEDYEVEIGNQCNCSAKMMALLVYYDEVMEYLKLQSEGSPLARMLFRDITKMEETINKEEDDSHLRQREADDVPLLDGLDLAAAAREMRPLNGDDIPRFSLQVT